MLVFLFGLKTSIPAENDNCANAAGTHLITTFAYWPGRTGNRPEVLLRLATKCCKEDDVMVVHKVLVGFAVAIGVFVLNHSNAAAQVSWPPLFAVLDGGNEVSAGGAANAGDPDGRR